MKTLIKTFFVFIVFPILGIFFMLILIIPGVLAVFILYLVVEDSPTTIFGIIVGLIVSYLFYFKTKLGKKILNYLISRFDKFNDFLEDL